MRKLRLSRSLFAVVTILSLLAFQNISARQSSQDEPIRLRTELVQLDVVVTDKRNNLVSDLKREDFVITEDGQTQQISHFSLVKSARKLSDIAAADPSKEPNAQTPQTPALESGEGRFVFVILDPAHISPSSYPRLRDYLVRFISEDLAPGDHAALISLKGGSVMFQQATRNKAVISMALDAFLGGKLAGGSTPVNSLAVEYPESHSRRELALGFEGIDSVIQQNFQIERSYQLRTNLNTLSSIAKNVSQLPGRKIAILVSEDLSIWLTPKNVTFPQNLDTNTLTYFENFSYEMQQVIGQARRGGLVFYTLDPRGLMTQIPGGTAAEAVGKSALSNESSHDERLAEAEKMIAQINDSREGLRQLAAATGGFAIIDRNDFSLGLQKVLADNEAYYLLGYYPTNSAQDGKFRKVDIKVKGRPDLTVRHRLGYIAAKENDSKARSESKEDRVMKAISSLVPVRNVRVSLTGITTARDAGALKAGMIIHIDPGSGMFKQEGDRHRLSFDVVAFVYDINGRLVNGLSKTYNLKMKPEEYRRALEGIDLRERVGLGKAKLFNLRVAVINRHTGDIGTASEWIEAQ